jgi:HAD superfamily hydrolase (TIGR01549 family)
VQEKRSENEALTVGCDQCIFPRVIGAEGGAALDRDSVDAVLFDLDGTLMDTDDQMVEAVAVWLQALRLQRLGRPSVYRVARCVVIAAEGPVNGLLTLLDILGLDAPLLGIWRWFRRLRGVATPDYRLMEDADAVLAALKPHYRLGIVTTRGREDAEAFLDKHDLRGLFGTIVTRETTWRLKPHPDPIREAARQLGVPVGRCVMVGDTIVDVKSARRAGARSVAVSCGFGGRDELEQAGADAVLDGLSDLLFVL